MIQEINAHYTHTVNIILAIDSVCFSTYPPLHLPHFLQLPLLLLIPSLFLSLVPPSHVPMHPSLSSLSLPRFIASSHPTFLMKPCTFLGANASQQLNKLFSLSCLANQLQYNNYNTVGCKKKSPFRPRRTGVARLDRYRFHTVPRAFNFLHRLTSSVARLFNVHEETVRSIAMYVRR